MSTRTFDAIQADVNHALGINDVELLMKHVEELDTLNTPQAMALASFSRGWAFYLLGDYSAALEHNHRALALYEELGNRSGVARAIGNMGALNYWTGDYPAALTHFHRTLELHEELGNRRGVALVTGNLGNVHWSTGEYPEALSHYHRALALQDELGDRSGVAIVTANIGMVYASTGDYTEALSHYHRALALHEELGDRNSAARVTSNIGTVHSSTGDYPEALSHYHRALALHEEIGDRSGVAHVLSNILTAYIGMGSDSEAQQLLATMDAMQIDDPGVRIEREQHRATLLERSGDLDGATVTLQRALVEASEHGLLAQVANKHKALRDLAQKRNDFAGYIEHNNEFTRITEEINGKDTATKLAMQAKQREIDAVQRKHAQYMAVLHSTLPKHIADRVARGEVVNDHFDRASVLFLDVVGFTTHSSVLAAADVVDLLQKIFTTFDAICAELDVMKIKTIGDSYMAVAFPNASSTGEQRAANTARAMIASPFTWPSSERVQFRIGLHSGPVVAGVLGTERLQYDVWGDTVNVASRMESTSAPGRIHVSEAFADALKGENAKERNGGDSSPFPVPSSLIPRGALEIKGKGQMKTYWLE